MFCLKRQTCTASLSNHCTPHHTQKRVQTRTVYTERLADTQPNVSRTLSLSRTLSHERRHYLQPLRPGKVMHDAHTLHTRSSALEPAVAPTTAPTAESTTELTAESTLDRCGSGPLAHERRDRRNGGTGGECRPFPLHKRVEALARRKCMLSIAGTVRAWCARACLPPPPWLCVPRTRASWERGATW